MELTAKQHRFVEEYQIDSNATQAAIRAGYKHPDNGRQLLTKTHVAEAVDLAPLAFFFRAAAGFLAPRAIRRPSGAGRQKRA